MFLIDTILLVSGVLLLLGIASSKLAVRIGVPVLVLFLVLGMLAGSEGIGGIEFENYQVAHAIGTVALAMILFDGGLSTPLSAIRTSWRPSLVLATAGVLITAVITGLAASWVLGLTLLEGLLLGSMVGSTDAAAVFAVLRSGGVALRPRLSALLEIESASNDPMAIFLTIGCIELIAGRITPGAGLLSLFISQMAIGGLVGLAVGYVAVRVVNLINLDTAGLYPVLVTAVGLVTFGLAARLGGSGFLAVYLAGIVLGNSRLVFQRGISLFHDAAAWLCQIVMFVVLGLLSFPSRLIDVAWQGFLIGAVLIVVARPVAVGLALLPFRYHWREVLFISWVGLKGAVPITLATFPLFFDTPKAGLLFDVVFFVVVLSAVVQGWSLPLVARWLKLQVEAQPAAPVTLELSSLRHVEGDIVDYTVGPHSRAAGRLVRELALPEGVVIALVARGQEIIPPQGSTRIKPGDHVVLVLRAQTRSLVNQIFASTRPTLGELPAELEFPLRGATTIGELEGIYGIDMDAAAEDTLDEAIRKRLGEAPVTVGALVSYGPIALRIRGLSPSGQIEHVGMIVLPETHAQTMSEEAQDTSGQI